MNVYMVASRELSNNWRATNKADWPLITRKLEQEICDLAASMNEKISFHAYKDDSLDCDITLLECSEVMIDAVRALPTVLSVEMEKFFKTIHARDGVSAAAKPKLPQFSL